MVFLGAFLFPSLPLAIEAKNKPASFASQSEGGGQN